MPKGDSIENSLKEWLDKHLPLFLNNINSEFLDEQPWNMPVIEDYILVVAVKDYNDGLGGVFSVGASDVPPYRIKGLLREVLEN